MNARRFLVTPLANHDIEDIGRFTGKVWGRKQRNTYLRALDARFQWLADNPRVGTARTEFTTPLFSFPEGSHIIFYRMIPEGMEILRVLHNRMQPENYLR